MGYVVLCIFLKDAVSSDQGQQLGDVIASL